MNRNGTCNFLCVRFLLDNFAKQCCKANTYNKKLDFVVFIAYKTSIFKQKIKKTKQNYTIIGKQKQNRKWANNNSLFIIIEQDSKSNAYDKNFNNNNNARKKNKN